MDVQKAQQTQWLNALAALKHPLFVALAGLVLGALAQAFGTVLYEQFSYGADGSLLSGTFADYLLPTATEVPDSELLHMESPSPFTPLGAKGMGEGGTINFWQRRIERRADEGQQGQGISHCRRSPPRRSPSASRRPRRPYQ